MIDSDSLRDKIVESYVLQGTPEPVAGAFVDAAFTAHEVIEQCRTDTVIAQVGALPQGLGPNFMLLVVQLEIMHLNGVLNALAEQLGMPLNPTVQ